jgi:hypothetical protein
MARTLAIGANPVPITLRPPAINDNGEKSKDSVLMVKGNTFAPGAKTGMYLEKS